jgi:hypothetical protein
VSCAEGDTGFVYRGELEVEIISLSLDSIPKAPVKITMNVGNPSSPSSSGACRTKASASRGWSSSSRA